MWTKEFLEPLSLQECETRIAATLSDMQIIEAQLSDKNKLAGTGKRLTETEFHEWRTKAVGALKFKQSQVIQLKAWRKNAVEKRPIDGKPFFPFIGQVINKARLQAIAGQVEQCLIESGCVPGKDYQPRNIIEIAAHLYSQRNGGQESK